MAACAACGKRLVSNQWWRICKDCATTGDGRCRGCGEAPSYSTDWFCTYNDPVHGGHVCYNCSACCCDGCVAHRSERKAAAGAALRAKLDAKAKRCSGGKKKKK